MATYGFSDFPQANYGHMSNMWYMYSYGSSHQHTVWNHMQPHCGPTGRQRGGDRVRPYDLTAAQGRTVCDHMWPYRLVARYSALCAT